MFLKGVQTLQGKDVQAFKSLAKFHDAKNYKKGLKAALKVLETNPNHPQTLAMKALFQSGIGEEQKALETAKTAVLKSKMQSLLCWHTYGSLLKNKKDYVEASKCFHQALRIDPDNLQILREAANIFIQIRDHSNHVSTRFTILKLKSNSIQHWISFALAYHLKGEFVQLFKALKSIDNLIKGLQLKPQQISQYHLYRVLVFKDAKNYQGMFDELLKNETRILDKTLWREQMVVCCQKLDKKDEMNKNMCLLIQQFPQNLQYLEKYRKILGENGRDFYKRMNLEYKSKISKVMQISYIQQQAEFKQQFADFIKPYYQKNLISLYRQIQCLYSSQNKSNWIGQIFTDFEISLKKGLYPDNSEMQSPTQYLWSLYILSQHLSRKFETLPKAHQKIVQAISHTNTLSQLYLIKAQIQYKQHNNIQAIKTINEARKTDLADRYMNNICVKYLMKCQRPIIAEEVLRLFMKDQANLYELQNQWYIIEAGKSFLKSRKFPQGLRHLHFIQKQFQDMYGNHYDFHTYCIRKWTLREYVQLISFNDNLYQDKKYIQAAGNAIPNLFEFQHLLKNPKEEVKVEEQKTDDGKKKKKKKKQQIQVEQQPPIQIFRKKIDYYGKQYVQKIKSDPMKQAYTYAINVASTKYNNKNNQHQNKLYFKAFSKSIDVFIRYNKPLLVIKCLKKLYKTNYNQSDVHLYTLKALIYLQKALKQAKQQIKKQFIQDFIKQILQQSKTIEQYHEKICKNLKESFQKKIKCKQQFNIVLKKGDDRKQYINLYMSQLSRFMKQENIKWNQLQLLFYIVHKLQFYGELTNQIKDNLNKNLGKLTNYFSDWQKQFQKLPPSTWSLWWLSQYDQQREQIEFQKLNANEQTETKINQAPENSSK